MQNLYTWDAEERKQAFLRLSLHKKCGVCGRVAESGSPVRKNDNWRKQTC